MSPQVSFNRLQLDDELRLRDLVIESCHNLEPDLRVVGGRLPIGGSRVLDLVGVDSQARLALLEVRCRESPEWILDAIDHYDWAREHLEEVMRLYPQHPIDASRAPRLILIATSFSEDFRRRLVYLDSVPVELAEYRYLEVNGVRGLYFEPVGLPPGRRPPYPSSLQDHLDRMTEADRGGVAERLVARTAALDPGVRLIVHRGGALVVWEERLLARLEFNRAGVWVSDEVAGGGTEVRRMSDLEPVLSGLAARVAHWRRLARPATGRNGWRAAGPASGAAATSGPSSSPASRETADEPAHTALADGPAAALPSTRATAHGHGRAPSPRR